MSTSPSGTASWFLEVVNLAEQLAAAADFADALCNAVPDDTAGDWAIDVRLARVEILAALRRCLSVLEGGGRFTELRKIQDQQELTDLH